MEEHANVLTTATQKKRVVAGSFAIKTHGKNSLCIEYSKILDVFDIFKKFIHNYNIRALVSESETNRLYRHAAKPSSRIPRKSMFFFIIVWVLEKEWLDQNMSDEDLLPTTLIAKTLGKFCRRGP